MRLFGRRWRWTVDALTSSDSFTNADGAVIGGPDITFDVHRSLSTSSPGTAELRIYNLTESHRAQIHGTARGALVRIEAGYRDAMPILFNGDLSRADIVRDGPDWIAVVAAGDGLQRFRTARVALSLGPGTTVGQAQEALIAAMGVGAGNASQAFASSTIDPPGHAVSVEDAFRGAAYPEGVVFHGLAMDHFSSLCRSAGLSWSIQDGVIQVVPRGSSLEREAIVIDADHGMVDSPEVGANHVAKVRCLLIPDLVPGRKVRLASAVASGVYRIEKADYTGDTRGNDWYASLEMRTVAGAVQ